MPPALRRARILAGGAAVLILTACSNAPEQTTATTTTHASEFGHVHALTFDDRALYAATHFGVWQLPYPTTDAADPASLRRIGAGTQDTMGMTLGTDGALYASGHPGPGEAPELSVPNLGLIRSDDDARTWESISLRGEVDFHALTTTSVNGREQIAGLDSATSTILVSDDGGATWDRRAKEPAHDLAFLPQSADRLIATTPNGLVMSTDAGRSFTVVAGAPLLLLVETMPGGRIVGIDTAGTVWTGSPELADWQSHGTLPDGAAQAMTYGAGAAPDDPSLLAVATDEAVVTSADLGASWQTVVAPS